MTMVCISGLLRYISRNIRIATLGHFETAIQWIILFIPMLLGGAAATTRLPRDLTHDSVYNETSSNNPV